MDSLCVTWIPSEDRYRVTILPKAGELITEYVEDMHQLLELMHYLEEKYAA